jgi:hypothetical protein
MLSLTNDGWHSRSRGPAVTAPPSLAGQPAAALRSRIDVGVSSLTLAHQHLLPRRRTAAQAAVAVSYDLEYAWVGGDRRPYISQASASRYNVASSG